MQDIYDKRDIIDKVNELREKVREEQEKGNIETARKLLLAQFYEGLKLSIR